MSTSTITRSAGINPGVPWGGPMPGGGYEGKTKRLDRAVMRFAEWLQARIAGPVQVRFNSHRLSGGAFIYPHAAPDAKIGFDTPEIGLGVRLIIPAAVNRRRDRAWNRGEGYSLPPLEHEDCWTEATPLSYSVLIYPQFLRDPTDLGEERSATSRFGYWTVKTPQAAYALLRRLVNFPVRR